MATQPEDPLTADRRPPWLAADERSTLQALLQYHRESVVRKVDGLDDEQARWSPLRTGTSVLWLLKHLTDAETLWFVVRFAGQPAEPPDDVENRDTVAAAVTAYRRSWERVDEIIARAALDDRCRGLDTDVEVNLRWVLAHLLEETARHAGHADILRELIDGRTGR